MLIINFKRYQSPMDLNRYHLKMKNRKLKIVPATHAEKKIFPNPADKISCVKRESRHLNLARYKYNILLFYHVIRNFLTEGLLLCGWMSWIVTHPSAVLVTGPSDNTAYEGICMIVTQEKLQYLKRCDMELRIFGNIFIILMNKKYLLVLVVLIPYTVQH